MFEVPTTFHGSIGCPLCIHHANLSDPACGSGNFLTETYICLRRLENKILSVLDNNQISLSFDDVDATPLKVSLDQFYGIEINDFAVSVASTALWIAQLQANIEAEIIITRNIEDLPLRDSAHIHHANALTTDWSTFIDPAICDYIIGNPPFLGARNQTKEQKQEIKDIFPKGTKNVGNIDYVAGWYIQAANFMQDYPVRTAFVSTNSIVQGEQVANIWSPIFELGFRINFAHNTFRWTNEATEQAHVFCVIVGFSKHNDTVQLFHYPTPDSEPELKYPTQLNAYLADAPMIFVWDRKKPLCDVPKIGIGNKPIDGGHYLFTSEEKAEFLAQEPYAEKFFHQWMGARELIQGIERWVLWLGEATPADFKNMPLALERVRAVRDYRLASTSTPTQKIADKPTRFHVENMPNGDSIIIPRVSATRRKYIPMDFVSPHTLCSDSSLLIADATLYHLGILLSSLHNSWIRQICGRLKNDYRYSGGVVYNNFIWPETDEKTEKKIASLAQKILDARGLYNGATLADMYDPDNDFLYPELMNAHKELDLAVEKAYGLNIPQKLDATIREQYIVEHLFKLYDEYDK
ncbi:DNA methyltransferase [Corynebacterium sp. sy039]|uniref:DNA methyltransferase n=1 Tax=Corynebacterium sp. sy039 TaxID=2599641 RepID=UPI0011B55F35|nr:class I SAM-dependent DNA methyltransferase [Corynebacterium sp. sy039]